MLKAARALLAKFLALSLLSVIYVATEIHGLNVFKIILLSNPFIPSLILDFRYLISDLFFQMLFCQSSHASI